MYQILCDNEIIYDPRIELLKVLEPRCKLEVNTVGEASFDMLPTHPYYRALKPLKSVIEIKQGNHILFRGRMTNNSREIFNRLSVDLEGILATTNGSYVPPFSFPDDFTIPDGANVVEVLLAWFLDVHNSQVQPWQRLKVGTVTVTDPNNVIVRSSEKFLSTWDCLREKLFESSLGGKLYARYEADGTYVDYVSSYALTNVQRIKLGTNILSLDQKLDGQETYSAILPIGKDGMTIADLEDGDITTDFVKQGNFIYSKQALESYGWACAPVSDTTWDDVTEITNLRRKAVDALSDMVQLVREITVTALDQNFTDEQVQSLRAFRNVIVESSPHDLNTELFPLDRLDIDLHNPQNTKITVGKSQKTMAESTSQKFSDSIVKAEQAASIAQGVNKKVDTIGKNSIVSVTVEYYLSTSETETAGGEWQAEIPEWVEGRFTWSRTKTVDANGKITFSPSECGACIASGKSQKGADGRGIQSITNYYLATAADSEVTVQTAGWTTTVQAISKEKKYLWNYETITYTDGSTPFQSTPCIIGSFGADGKPGTPGDPGTNGVGIESITEHYAVSDSNTTEPATWQETVPQMTMEHRYLWNYETITYTDGSTKDTSKRVIGVYGDPGDTGRSVVSITPEYYLSTSNTAQEGGEWLETAPDWEDGKYIWTRSKIVYKDPEGIEYTDPVCDTAWESLRNNLAEVKQQVISLETSMVSTAESIIMAAMADYVKTGDYESYQETVKSQLAILANEITMKFTSVTEQVQNVDGDMQSRFESLSKCIKYSGETAVSISSGNSVIVLELDNEKGIVFKKNGVQFGWWDGTDFHTGNIVVEVNERAQFGDFAWVPRSDRSLMFLKVAGVTEEPPALDIIQEPASTSAKVGESFTFTIHAVGDNVQYQWQVNSGSSWADLSNGNSMSYTGTAQSGCDGWKYRCIVSDDSGDSMESTEAILSIEVDFNYTVNPVSGATYGFALNSDGWYESQNKGVHSTYAVCRVNFQCSVDTPIYICCINSGEQGYDYGIVGNLDTALTATITDTDYLWKATSSSASAIIDVDLTVPAGSHFVDIKYRKDGSASSGNDSLQFMIEVV